MAAINDLVAQIKDEALRRQIKAELKRVMKHKKFLDYTLKNYAKTPYKPQKYSYFLIYNPKSWRNILIYENYFVPLQRKTIK